MLEQSSPLVSRIIKGLSWLWDPVERCLVVAAHVAARYVFKLPLNAQHWSTAESRAGAAGVWRSHLAGDVYIFVSRAVLLEEERNIYYLLNVLVS